MKKELYNLLRYNQVDLLFSVNRYDYERHNQIIEKKYIDADEQTFKIQNSSWAIKTNIKALNTNSGGFDVSVKFSCLEGAVDEASVSMELAFNNWSDKNYVLMPAAVYNGNRYDSRPQPYMPFFYNFDDISKEPKILLSDVPRLNNSEGFSKIDERSGSMSTPSIGFHDPTHKKGFWLFTEQGTSFGDHGISIEENRERSRAFIKLTNPVVRELFQYNMTNTRHNTTDKPTNFKAGDSIELNFQLYFFESKNIQTIYNKFNILRNTIALPAEDLNVLPYSIAFSIQEEKFNQQNYVEEHGYYAVGMQENSFQDWQIGWTGGMITTLPLLQNGSKTTKARVLRNFDWLFNNTISPGGLFWGIGEKGTIFHGEFERTKPLGKDLLLVRKIGDAIYYILKQFMLMHKMEIEVKQDWENKLKDVIDTLIKVWKDNHQLGHYLNIHTNEIAVGGSTSGGIVPGGLCLAAAYYDNIEYLNYAKEIGEHFYQNYVAKGITYGGVGDAMHNFDSESSYGLLESFALLFEHTQEKKWLTVSEEMANQFATWVSNYDYKFPETSLFGKLNMKTRGTVFANTQNKHLAPGICTHSGIALWRIFRATKNTFYLNLLNSMVRTIPQYLSHQDRKIPGMKDGWMSERVNSTDWWEPIGEIFCGSTWSETACMLSYAEIPGVYIVPDLELVMANDNIEANIISKTDKQIKIIISNKTNYDCCVNVLIESENKLSQPLGENALYKCLKINAKENSAEIFSLPFENR